MDSTEKDFLTDENQPETMVSEAENSVLEAEAVVSLSISDDDSSSISNENEEPTISDEESEKSFAAATKPMNVLVKPKKEAVSDERRWFCLRVISGKEKKIKERIEMEIERSGWQDYVFQIIVPTEKVYKMKNGKKVMSERNLLPGYILIEAISAKLNGDVAKAIADTQHVIHFLGKEQPIPMTNIEARRLLGIVDDQSETGASLVEPFIIGEPVKIIDGPFAEFIGDIQKVDDEKKKLTVIVKIFGRGTEMELNYMQVEKIS